MSILVATPMYGSQCSELYFQSSLALSKASERAGLEIDWLTIGNESLIQRARNTCAARFLEGDWERLLFIDADIGFTPDDVAALWNADADIVAGIVPMKSPGTYNAWKDGEMVRPSESCGALEVDYVGTAFMMITRRVFEEMKPLVMEYEEPRVEGGKAWTFFHPGVHEEQKLFVSEDYAFLDVARERGFCAVVLPNLKLRHAGMTVFE